MKKRAFAMLNFLALNVLFFAIYLNFIHKDTNMLPAVSTASTVSVKSSTASQVKNPLAANTQQKTEASTLGN